VTTRHAKPDAHDITCRQAVALMTDYLDGALSQDDVDLVEAHLGECEGCAEHPRQPASPSRSPAGSARMTWIPGPGKTS
jgi:anti-sigma factor RsiW